MRFPRTTVREDVRVPSLSAACWRCVPVPKWGYLPPSRGATSGGSWAARSARRLGLPTPEEAESLAVPTQEGVGFDVHQRVPPSEALTQGRHHPAGGLVGPPRPDLPLQEQRQLLSQEAVLGYQRRPRTCGEGNQSDQVNSNQKQGPQAMHDSGKAQGTRHGLPRIARYETSLARACRLGR